MTEISAIHFTTGMIIVGSILTKNDHEVTVGNPITLLPRQERQGISMSFVPVGFPLYQSVKEQPKSVNFNRSTIIMMHELDSVVHKDLLDNYKQLFSTVILPTSGFKL